MTTFDFHCVYVPLNSKRRFERNRIAFRNGSLVVQRLKHSFVSNLRDWNSWYIGEEISSLIGFFGVVGFKLRGW